MGFLRTNDLSEIKTGELNLDFGVGLVKNREVDVLQLKIK